MHHGIRCYTQTATMEGQLHNIDNNRTQYLTKPVFNWFVPSNIAILVDLYKHGISLPENSTSLYFLSSSLVTKIRLVPMVLQN